MLVSFVGQDVSVKELISSFDRAVLQEHDEVIDVVDALVTNVFVEEEPGKLEESEKFSYTFFVWVFIFLTILETSVSEKPRMYPLITNLWCS